MRKSSTPTLKEFRICLPNTAAMTRSAATATDASMRIRWALVLWVCRIRWNVDRDNSHRVDQPEEKHRHLDELVPRHGQAQSQREVRPFLTEILVGRQGHAFDRLEMEAAAEDYKARNGRPAADNTRMMRSCRCGARSLVSSWPMSCGARIGVTPATYVRCSCV
jgi:hypothetical protein